MVHRYITNSLIFALLTASCGPAEPPQPGESPATFPVYELKPGNPTDIADITELVKIVHTIELTPEVALQVGSIFHFFVMDNEDLILVDEIAGRITRLTPKGNVVWQIEPQDGDYRYYTSIRECTYDVYRKQIIVYDNSEEYIFDLDGQPVSVKKGFGDFDFRQLAIASSEDRIYSAQGLNLYWDDGPRKQLLWLKNGELQKEFINQVPFAPRHVQTSGFEEFSTLNGHLHYYATLRDTCYRIDLPEVKPAFLLKFTGGETTEDIMLMDKIPNKLKYLNTREIPYLLNLAADEKQLVAIYKKGRYIFSNLLDRRSGTWTFNNAIFRYKELTFPAPLHYHNGYLLRNIPEGLLDHYQKIPAADQKATEEWRKEMLKLPQGYEDAGSTTIYLIKL